MMKHWCVAPSNINKFDLVEVNSVIAHKLLLSRLLLLCGAGERLKQNTNLFATKYVIALKYRKYPIDDKIFIDAEVRVQRAVYVVGIIFLSCHVFYG